MNEFFRFYGKKVSATWYDQNASQRLPIKITTHKVSHHLLALFGKFVVYVCDFKVGPMILSVVFLLVLQRHWNGFLHTGGPLLCYFCWREKVAVSKNITVVKLILINSSTAKGQIKPKADWHGGDCPKKQMNEFVFLPWKAKKQKNPNSFVHYFFGRIYSLPICLQSYLTFTSYTNFATV